MRDHFPAPVPDTIDEARLPAVYESARAALANCESVDECKDWADRSAALASYAKQAQDEALELMARRIRNRAIRRMGEVLQGIPKGHGLNQNITDGTDSNVPTRKQVARRAGISERQQVQAVRLANVPQAEFDTATESDTPATVTDLARRGTRHKPRPPASPDKETASPVGGLFLSELGEAVDTLRRWRDMAPIMTLAQTERAAAMAKDITQIAGEMAEVLTA